MNFQKTIFSILLLPFMQVKDLSKGSFMNIIESPRINVDEAEKQPKIALSLDLDSCFFLPEVDELEHRVNLLESRIDEANDNREDDNESDEDIFNDLYHIGTTLPEENIQEFDNSTVDQFNDDLAELYSYGATYYTVSKCSSESNYAKKEFLNEAVRILEKVIDQAKIFSTEIYQGSLSCNISWIEIECKGRFGRESKSVTSPESIDMISVTKAFELLQKVYVEQEREQLNSNGKLTNVTSNSSFLKALAASEHARALHIDAAIVRNLGTQPSVSDGNYDSRLEDFFEGIYAKRSSIEELKQIARNENAWIVNYSTSSLRELNGYSYSNLSNITLPDIFTLSLSNPIEDYLYIWVISPSGRISFINQTSDIAELEEELNQLEEELKDDLLSSEPCQESSTSDCRAVQISALNQGVRSLLRGLGVNGREQNHEADDETVTSSAQSIHTSRLYEILVEPIEEFLPVTDSQRIIIVPDGPLHFVPFSILVNPDNQKYFIQQNTLSMSPSFRNLLLSRQNREEQDLHESKNVLIAANPDMPISDNSTGHYPDDLYSLPGTEQEAKAIRDSMLKVGGYKIDLLKNSDASEENVVQRMSSSQIIHLATHGIIETEDFFNNEESLPTNILNSTDEIIADKIRSNTITNRWYGPQAIGSLVFSDSSDNDGLLDAREIASLNLSETELVVLSACNTGRGNLSPGGVIGLPFAFSLAGVPTTIVSLWSVEDQSTAEFMTLFYEQLLGDPTFDKGKALRDTMLEMITRYPNNPKKWGAFTLVGAHN